MATPRGGPADSHAGLARRPRRAIAAPFGRPPRREGGLPVAAPAWPARPWPCCSAGCPSLPRALTRRGLDSGREGERRQRQPRGLDGGRGGGPQWWARGWEEATAAGNAQRWARRCLDGGRHGLDDGRRHGLDDGRPGVLDGRARPQRQVGPSEMARRSPSRKVPSDGSGWQADHDGEALGWRFFFWFLLFLEDQVQIQSLLEMPVYHPDLDGSAVSRIPGASSTGGKQCRP
ncbi:hypothetical protein PVAP13_5KG483800 [Panicum virgatum]|uniref:Uncharacterized protein n=1 Tax=Panicum virgatum TaxID=38727 RepID=A0A8T0SN04_PANVG|nr:hypothetical protein PVAP13_5KG483800 [Panicum virgatum]